MTSNESALARWNRAEKARKANIPFTASNSIYSMLSLVRAARIPTASLVGRVWRMGVMNRCVPFTQELVPMYGARLRAHP